MHRQSRPQRASKQHARVAQPKRAVHTAARPATRTVKTQQKRQHAPTTVSKRNHGSSPRILNTEVSDDAFKARYSDYFKQQRPGLEQYNSPDHNFEHYMIAPTKNDSKTANYFVMASAKAAYIGLGRASVSKFVTHLRASADVLAMASIELDLSSFEEGTTTTIKWRGKPVFVKHRTAEEIALSIKDDDADLRHPEKDADRAKVPNWLIVLGVCTHLGCVPLPNAGDYAGGFFCPCHGSGYDASGRIRYGPAPLNLEIPPYRFLDDKTVFIG